MTSYEIEIEALERITSGGVRRVSWHVLSDGEWVTAATLPAAQVQHLDRGPGIVWQQLVRVQLPLGSRLMRVESFPERSPPKDPMDYLWAERRGAPRATRRSYFRVAPGGRLVRMEREDG